MSPKPTLCTKSKHEALVSIDCHLARFDLESSLDEGTPLWVGCLAGAGR